MDEPRDRAHGVPEMAPVRVPMLKEALRRGWADLRRAPGYAVFFTSVYVVAGWLMAWVSWATGQTYWLFFAVMAFPLVGSFAATGFYEISHRLEQGWPLDRKAILGVIAHQRLRQLPLLSATIVVIVLFWLFLAHIIFALFLGLSEMTNISSSFTVFQTARGAAMLAFGGAVGACFALLVYAISVMGLPLLLDREVDFVTAMIASVRSVLLSPGPMLGWAALIAVVTFLALIPAFLGLFLVLPWLGHAAWHLYRLSVEAAG